MARLIGPAVVVGAAVVTLLLPVRTSHAWGPEGHRVVALIADRVLQQSDAGARAKVVALLASDKADRLAKPDIASQAIWANALREKSEEARGATTPWHSTRLKPDGPDLASACFGRKPLPVGYPASRGPRDNCGVDKIEGTPEAWAQESLELAKTVAYELATEQSAGKHNFPAKKGQAEKCPSVDLYRVGPDYETKALAAVKQQLLKAGVRLARVLRDGFK